MNQRIRKFRRALGYNFLANKQSKEIHDMSRSTMLCHIPDIAKHNRKWMTEAQMLKAVNSHEYNGCRWCMKLYDRG